jgi:hypothetical protein
MLNDWAIVRVMEGAAAYHFRFFQYFINRKATMKPIRTTGQCLLAHFQNGLSSVDRRRKNSVKRSITSPGTKISLGSPTVLYSWMTAKIVQGTQGVNLLEKSRFYAVAVSTQRTKSLSGTSNCELSGYMKGSLNA